MIRQGESGSTRQKDSDIHGASAEPRSPTDSVGGGNRGKPPEGETLQPEPGRDDEPDSGEVAYDALRSELRDTLDVEAGLSQVLGQPTDKLGREIVDEAESIAKRQMTQGERPSDSEVQSVLMNAILGHNETSPRRIPVSEQTRFDIEIPDTGVNNQLYVTAEHPGGSTSFAYMGHYDPGMQRFVIYPELVPDVEARVIEPLTRERRAQTVAAYSQYDYDADVVRDLWQKHREVLLEDGLIYKIAERYKEFAPPEEKMFGIDEYLIDDSTSFIVCLTPKLGGIDKSDPTSTMASDLFTTDEAFISIALYGDLLREKDGTLGRKASSFLHLGARDLDDPEGRFVPLRGLMKDEEFEKIRGLVTELQHLKATSYPNLDTKRVALKQK